VEEDGVPVSRLQYDQNQPKKKTDKEVMATVSFLIQSRKGNVDVPDEMWKLQSGRTQNKAGAGAEAEAGAGAGAGAEAEAGAGADADAALDEGGRVFLGNMHTSKNQQLLQKHGITHIVNCTCDLPNHFEPPRSVGVTYLRFDEIDIFSTSFVGTLIQMQKKKTSSTKKELLDWVASHAVAESVRQLNRLLKGNNNNNNNLPEMQATTFCCFSNRCLISLTKQSLVAAMF